MNRGILTGEKRAGISNRQKSGGKSNFSSIKIVIRIKFESPERRLREAVK